MRLPLNIAVYIPFIISVAVVLWNEFAVGPGQRYPFLATLPFLFTGVVLSRVVGEFKKHDS